MEYWDLNARDFLTILLFLGPRSWSLFLDIEGKSSGSPNMIVSKLSRLLNFLYIHVKCKWGKIHLFNKLVCCRFMVLAKNSMISGSETEVRSLVTTRTVTRRSAFLLVPWVCFSWVCFSRVIGKNGLEQEAWAEGTHIFRNRYYWCLYLTLEGNIDFFLKKSCLFIWKN